MAKEGHLPPRDNGRTKAAAPLERGASSEILPVEKFWGIDDFQVYFILLATICQFFFHFCYNLFVPFLAQGGRYFFYKHIFFKEEYSDTTLSFHMDVYYKWIYYTGNKVHNVDGSPKQ